MYNIVDVPAYVGDNYNKYNAETSLYLFRLRTITDNISHKALLNLCMHQNRNVPKIET